MTLNQMRYFLAVCEYEKIVVAAEHLHISEPSLSIAIRRLEEELNFPLFVRERKKLNLTAEGKFVRDRVSKIVMDVDNLDKELLRLRSAPQVIRLGASPFQSDYLCSLLISEFIRDHPNVRFDTPAFGSQDAVRQVENEKIEFALINEMAMTSDQLEYVPLFQAGIRGYVRRDHPLAGRKDVTPRMLNGRKLVLMGARSLRSRKILQWFHSVGEEPDIFMYSTRRQLTFTMVQRHDAVALLGEEPELLGDSSLLPPADVASFTLSPPIRISNGIIRKKGARLSREANSFFVFCRQSDILKRALSENL